MSGGPFVTGGHGFAGRHLLDLLEGAAVAPSRTELDLLDGEAVRRMVAAATPDVVFHLAALPSVGRSWREPARVISENVAMTVNVLEAVRLEAPSARRGDLGLGRDLRASGAAARG